MNDPAAAVTGLALDRADHLRADPDGLAPYMNWKARVLKLDGLEPVLTPARALEWGTLADCDPDAELLFLGLADGRGYFAAVPEGHSNGAARMSAPARAAMAALGADDLETFAMARSMVDWHARHRFCAQCGAPTQIAKGGWQRTCGSCKAEHFPRVDPVTIMLVECDGQLLLGRQPNFPGGFYSALAGFVEPGETIESAVRREVLEEAGVAVRDVSYCSSQAWPFPSQLMIGCHAFADDPAITIDTTELEDARWFTRQDVADAMAGRDSASFTPPPSMAIAHHLIRWWLAR